MYMSDGFSSARYPCTQEALGAGEKRSFSEGTYLRFALGVRVLYFFLTLEPSVEWYNNPRALNTSPPRNRSAFLLSGCSSIENCTTWYSSHSDFERGVVGDVRRSPGERTDACMAWTGRSVLRTVIIALSGVWGLGGSPKLSLVNYRTTISVDLYSYEPTGVRPA